MRCAHRVVAFDLRSNAGDEAAEYSALVSSSAAAQQIRFSSRLTLILAREPGSSQGASLESGARGPYPTTARRAQRHVWESLFVVVPSRASAHFSIREAHSRVKKRILVLYYSQTGEAARVVDNFSRPLEEAGHEVVRRQFAPVQAYPYPWSPNAFLDVFPQCLNGDAPEIRIKGGDIAGKFDLVVLAYQVWFLSPSLPTQGFLSSPAASVLEGAPVITLTVCRNMWHNGYLKLRAMLETHGANVIDNVVVTHQGAAWTTFITTVRSLLTGRKDRVLGMAPASVSEARLTEIAQYGGRVAQRLAESDAVPREPMLRHCGAARIDRHYLVPEIIGGRAFHAWAKAAKAIGRHSRLGQRLFLYLFIVTLALGIITVIPVTILALKLFERQWRGAIEQRIALLEAPSGP